MGPGARWTGEDSLGVGFAVAVGDRRSTLALQGGRLVARRGRNAGCRWGSRSVLLTTLVGQSFEVGRQALCSEQGRCRRLMEDRPEVLGFVAGAVRRVAP